MTQIYEDNSGPATGSAANRRLSVAPAAIAALIAALQAEPSIAGQLIDLELKPQPENKQTLYLTGSNAVSGMPVFVKLNVTPWELHWMRTLGTHAPDLVPQVLAGGERLGVYALKWLVLERVPYQMGAAWGDRMYDLLAEAAVRFQIAAQSLDRRFTGIEGQDSTRRWIELGLREGCPGPLKHVLEQLDQDWDWVSRSCGLEVCFGDLTPVNALCRTPPPAGEPVLLIDPIPRVAPWAWDAAYCQTISTSSDVRMVRRMAEVRRRYGLHVPAEPDLDRLATIMLAWLSALWWGIAPWRHNDVPWRAQIERYVEAAASL